ncbi:MAG: tetratricopeptide repeat protein [Candidatus Eremiobacteraeota bacterium]|nr:tetratricopeptide repeat protein [Candidatus Eremiobacteraeota bacterium]
MKRNRSSFLATLLVLLGLSGTAAWPMGITVTENPERAKFYYHYGEAYLQKGDYHKAADEYSKALRLWSAYHEAYYRRALCTIKQAGIEGKPIDRKAVRDLEKAMALKPGYHDALLLMATYCTAVMEPLEGLDGAVACCEKFLSLPALPDSSYEEKRTTAAALLATLKAMRNEGDKWRGALSRNPYDIRALSALGTLFTEQGFLNEARNCFDRVLRVQPGSGAALTGLLKADFARYASGKPGGGKEPQKGQGYWRRIIEISGERSPEYAEKNKNELQRIAGNCENILQKDQKCADAFLLIGLVHDEQGSDEKALSSFRSFLALKPQASDATRYAEKRTGGP